MFDCGGNYINKQRLQNDIVFGLSAETLVISNLSKFFGEPVTKTANQYCSYDATSPSSKFEIKTRRCKSNQYFDTIIPVHKTRVQGRLVFVFNFEDGLFYIVFDPILFASFKVDNISAIRKGGIRTSLPHYYIPIEKLIRIDI